MTIRTFYIILAITVIGGVLHAQQPDSLRLQRSIVASAAFVTGDNLTNTYVITTENAIVKYDSVGRAVANFSNNRLGLATFIDVSNPLKILVWYPDFQTVVLLDRTLSEMGRLNFSRAQLFSVRCAAMAFDGNIWAFDDAVSKAVKLTLEGTVLLESQPLNIYFPKRFSATRIRDSGRSVYLNDPESGLCTLDQYANLQNVYNTFKMNDFETDGEWLFYFDKKHFNLQNQSRLQLLNIPLPAAALQKYNKIWAGKDALFLQNGKNLERYSWH